MFLWVCVFKFLAQLCVGVGRSRWVRRSWRRRWRTSKDWWKTSTLSHSTSFSVDNGIRQMATI